jgi:hypothetical protein
MWNITNFYTSILKHYGECKMQLNSNGLNIFKMNYLTCYNPNLGLVTKAKACKGGSQEWTPGIIFHAPGNVGERKGMNPHTPKWTSTLGVGILMNFQIFRGQLQRSKIIGLKNSLHHWKTLGT